MVIDFAKVNKVIGEVRKDLGEGLVGIDLWASADTKSLIYSYAGSDMYTWGMSPLPSLSPKKQTGKGIRDLIGQPEVITLFRKVRHKLEETLASADFPGLGGYYLVNLSNNQLVMMLSTASHQLFLLVDLSRTTMGILMSVALPRLLKALQ